MNDLPDKTLIDVQESNTAQVKLTLRVQESLRLPTHFLSEKTLIEVKESNST